MNEVKEKPWQKAIAFGLPLKVREIEIDGKAGMDIDGFFSYLYCYVLGPIDAFFTGGSHFSFFIYEGSYWKALWKYLKGEDS